LKHSVIRRARHSFSYSENNFIPEIHPNPKNVYGDLEETNVELRAENP
jgi:type II pantothenate kinase